MLEEQRDFDRADLAKLWPPASIPVLRDGDRVIGETLDHHRARRRRTAGSLAGSPPVGPHLRPVRLRRRSGDRRRHDRAALRRSAQCSGLGTSSRWPMECSRPSSRQREFLAGDAFTIADCAAAPGLFYALAIHPWDPGRASAADAVLPRVGTAAVLREGDRGRAALPAPVPAAMAGRHRPLPLTTDLAREPAES